MTRVLLLARLLVLPGVAVAEVPVQLPIGSAAIPEPPEVSAESWLLYDATFDVTLAQFNPDEPRAMASTTKMMTALLVMELGNLDDLVTVSARAAGVGESEIGLEAGEQLTLRQLVTALMIRSANDASIAVAEHLGGSVEGFVELMNERAVELGLKETSFANPHGLDAPGHHSSARDLLMLAREGMTHPLFAELARTRRAVLPENSEGRIRVVAATNKLLGTFEGALGVKTGYTGKAGLTLVSAAQRGDRVIFAVVLGSTAHFADAAALLEHGFNDFRMYAAVSAGASYAVRRDPAGDDAETVAAEDVTVIGEAEAELTVLPELRGGEPVLVARLGTEEVGTTTVTSASLPPLPSILDALWWLWEGKAFP